MKLKNLLFGIEVFIITLLPLLGLFSYLEYDYNDLWNILKPFITFSIGLIIGALPVFGLIVAYDIIGEK